MIIKTPAFVLRHSRFRESSLIVTFFTKECGKIKAVCKGVHRPKSKKGSHFELLNQLDLTLYDKPNRELQLVTDSSIVNYYTEIKGNFDLFMQASYVLELIDRMTHVHDPHDVLFKLMQTYFGSLTPSNRELFTAAFEVKLLRLLGIFPNLTTCILCKQPIESPMGISFEGGGIICDRPSCVHSYHGTVGITRDDIVKLFKLVKDPFQTIGSYQGGFTDFERVGTLIGSYVNYTTDGKLKTRKVLDEIKNSALERVL